MMRSGVGLLCLLGIGMLVSGPASAELQRVEAVGIYGIRDSMRAKVIPRDEAIGNALWEGVSRVALEVVGESAGSDPMAAQQVESSSADSSTSTLTETESLRKALGKDILPYTRSFRILEDQGEQPVLFEEKPEVATEYVVVVEVIVDVGRVTTALEQAGWIDSRSAGPSAEVRVEVLGLSRYEALEAVRTALREGLGATRVRTVEYSHERQVLAVEGPFEPRDLESWVARFESPRLALETLGIDVSGRRIRVQAVWSPLSEDLESTGEGA